MRAFLDDSCSKNICIYIYMPFRQREEGARMYSLFLGKYNWGKIASSPKVDWRTSHAIIRQIQPVHIYSLPAASCNYITSSMDENGLMGALNCAVGLSLSVI